METIAIFASGNGTNAEEIVRYLAHQTNIRVALIATDNPQAGVLARAGFLGLIPELMLEAFPRRIINIHPGLLPAFGGKGMYGDRVHQRVLDERCRVSGITIHLIDGEYDRGSTLCEVRLSVYPSDTVETLAERIHRLEHAYYPVVVSESLPTPILLSKAQLHTTPYAWHRIGQSWQPATISGNSYMGHYWIDPIVASNTKQGNGNDLIPSESPNVILAGDRLYLQLPKSWLSGSRAALLELYNHAGLKILTHSLATYVSSLSLADDPLTSGVYILRLTSGDQQYSCKIYCP